MEREKKTAVMLALVIGTILFICTIASGIIYQRLLPQVQKAEAVWKEDGYILPKEAVFVSKNGNCIYAIEEEAGRYQTKFILKEVLITIIREDGNFVIVRGIYNPEWNYAIGEDERLANGMEVKIVE